MPMLGTRDECDRLAERLQGLRVLAAVKQLISPSPLGLDLPEQRGASMDFRSWPGAGWRFDPGCMPPNTSLSSSTRTGELQRPRSELAARIRCRGSVRCSPLISDDARRRPIPTLPDTPKLGTEGSAGGAHLPDHRDQGTSPPQHPSAAKVRRHVGRPTQRPRRTTQQLDGRRSGTAGP